MDFLKYYIFSKKVQIDFKKIEVVRNWLVLIIIIKVKAYLKFTNYYCKFLKSYINIV